MHFFLPQNSSIAFFSIRLSRDSCRIGSESESKSYSNAFNDIQVIHVKILTFSPLDNGHFITVGTKFFMIMVSE